MATADYNQMDTEIRETLFHKHYLMGNLANATAIINKHMEDVNWVGFYLLHKDEMFLGPFQGDVAKARIPLFKGTVGKAMKNGRTQIDSGDEATKSEIAIPIFYNREPVGILDLRSATENRFSEEDQKQLEQIAKLIQRVWRHMY